jgi:BolA protein
MRPWEQILRQKIMAKISPALHFEVINESPNHGLQPEAEKHFRVVLVSPIFEGVARLERHRLVQDAVQDELRTHVHALSVQAYTPAEWSKKGATAFASPDCLGGGKHERGDS